MTEIVQGFETPPVIAAPVTAARAQGCKHLQNNGPLLIRHSREHDGFSKNRLPMSHRKGDLGIALVQSGGLELRSHYFCY